MSSTLFNSWTDKIRNLVMDIMWYGSGFWKKKLNQKGEACDIFLCTCRRVLYNPGILSLYGHKTQNGDIFKIN